MAKENYNVEFNNILAVDYPMTYYMAAELCLKLKRQGYPAKVVKSDLMSQHQDHITQLWNGE